MRITENPCPEVKYRIKKGTKAKKHPDTHNCKEKMLTIKCMCGASILVMPDLKEMALAIEKHVAAHQREDILEQTSRWAPIDLRQCLIAQLLKVASGDEEEF